MTKKQNSQSYFSVDKELQALENIKDYINNHTLAGESPVKKELIILEKLIKEYEDLKKEYQWVLYDRNDLNNKLYDIREALSECIKLT